MRRAVAFLAAAAVVIEALVLPASRRTDYPEMPVPIPPPPGK
jgi:hypothetical protein